MHRRIVVLLLAGGLALLACCGGTARRSPGTSVLKEYLEAIEGDDPQAAYRLMDEGYRKRVSKEQYLKRWKTYRKELLEYARRARAALKEKKNKEVTVEAKFKSGQSTTLVWQDGKWRLHEGAGTEIAGSGPKSTLIALVRAVDERDFKAFLKLLTRGRRRALVREIFKRLERLKANLDRPLEKRGTRVRFQYDSRHYIDLVKEDGVWKIYDFN